jgi:hypothetical protein
MGVLTTAYSIPCDVMRKIQGYKKHLEKVFNAKADWRFENYGFGKSWEEKIRIIGKCYPSTRNRLNHQKCWIYPDYDVWIVKPKEVQFVANDLSKTTFEGLKKWCNLPRRDGRREYVADANGEKIPEELYDYYIGDIENLKLFLRTAADDGNYLIFATA